MELFDPMFTPIDIEILRSDGYTLLSKNTVSHPFRVDSISGRDSVLLDPYG